MLDFKCTDCMEDFEILTDKDSHDIVCPYCKGNSIERRLTTGGYIWNCRPEGGTTKPKYTTGKR